MDAVFALKEALRCCKGKPRVFTNDAAFYKSAIRMLNLKHTIVCFGPRSAVERAFSKLDLGWRLLEKVTGILQENIFKITDKIRLQTNSTNIDVKTLFFIVALLLYNLWQWFRIEVQGITLRKFVKLLLEIIGIIAEKK